MPCAVLAEAREISIFVRWQLQFVAAEADLLNLNRQQRRNSEHLQLEEHLTNWTQQLVGSASVRAPGRCCVGRLRLMVEQARKRAASPSCFKVPR